MEKQANIDSDFLNQLTFEPLSRENWTKFVQLFGPRGACGNCWCMYYRLSKQDYLEGKANGTLLYSDLMFRFGKANGEIMEGNWPAEMKNIPPEFIPDPDRLALLQRNLLPLNPAFVATCHGPCLKF